MGCFPMSCMDCRNQRVCCFIGASLRKENNMVEIRHPDWVTIQENGKDVLGYNQEWYPETTL